MQISQLKISLILAISLFFTSALESRNSYNIKQVNLLIEPDFQTKELKIDARLEIQNPELQDTIYFWLNPELDIKDVNKQNDIKRKDRLITVILNKPQKNLNLHFKIHGFPKKSIDEERMIIADSSLFLLWSDCFYPMDFEDWAALRTEIILPENFLVMAPGKFVSSERHNGKTKHVFETSVPCICYSIMADSRWIKTEREINGIKMFTLLYPESQKYSEQIFSTSAEIINFFSKLCYPYPYDKFGFITIENIYARRAFCDFIGYNPIHLEKEMNSTGYDAHETSLLWWIYLTRGSGPGSFQWTEGFADYMEFLYDEQFKKPIPKTFKYFRDEYLKLKPENDVDFTELIGNTPQTIVHGKYPWLMQVIRYVVGDDAFKRGLNLLFERYKYRTFTIDEFISALEEGCGQSLSWWRREWLERKGVPEIRASLDSIKISDNYVSQIKIEQLGNLYHFPLELGIESDDGMIIKKINLDDYETILTIETKDKPTGIIVDPNNWLILKIQ